MADPSPSSQDEEYKLVGIAAQPLPLPVFTANVNDGTTHRMVAVSARLTLGSNGQMKRTTNVERSVDTAVIMTEDITYTGTFERNGSTIVVRFRPLDMYDDFIAHL